MVGMNFDKENHSKCVGLSARRNLNSSEDQKLQIPSEPSVDNFLSSQLEKLGGLGQTEFQDCRAKVKATVDEACLSSIRNLQVVFLAKFLNIFMLNLK